MVALRLLLHRAVRARVLVRVAPRARSTTAGSCALALCSLPLPWIAAELGWIVAEYGRQPWAIDGVLPTALGVSSVSAAQVATSLTGFVVFYTALLVVDVILMTKYIRLGPDGLGMWRSKPVTPPSAAPRTAEAAMLDYETLRIIWWLLLGIVLAASR